MQADPVQTRELAGRGHNEGAPPPLPAQGRVNAVSSGEKILRARKTLKGVK